MELDRQRLDKWLWFARVVKSRTLATRLVEAGHVRVNGIRARAAAKLVGPGDVLTVALECQVRLLRVVSPGLRRGPFRQARELFEDLGEPTAPPARECQSRPDPGLTRSGQGDSEKMRWG